MNEDKAKLFLVTMLFCVPMAMAWGFASFSVCRWLSIADSVGMAIAILGGAVIGWFAPEWLK